ncbi:NAC domain-containing protein 71 [Populus trichocarpa]|uniref:NAC domain-containing protein n=1 Tax=Populus trichocarpa TaxID=3694 RepID=A0A2K1Z479_POPTR|nr:NAC domain-containing protein 71 [Populus trichocarpa]|eukprot:XP_002313991.2 NAC domain-containing protein 71 [Populus trichocarpa]
MQGEHDSSNIEPPPGYRFCPTDVELACFYLYRKVNGLPLPNTVKDCNLYGDHEPWEIWEAFEGSELSNKDDLFFLTQLKNRSAKDSRSKRRVGRNGGTWKGDKKIGTFTFDTITWTRKRLSYQNPNSKKNDRCNYVHCLVRKKVTKRTDGTNVSHNHNAIEKSQRCDRPFALEEHHQAKRLKLDLAQPHQLICNYNQQTEAIPTGGMSAFATSHRRKVKVTP